MTRALLAALVGLSLLGFLARPFAAAAHAALVASEPAANAFLPKAPAEVVLTFSEPIALSSSSIRLLDARGIAIPLQAPTFSTVYTMRAALPALKPGIYNVLWANVSRVDGHGYQGAFPFTVLNPDGSVPDVVNQVSQVGGGTDPSPPADSVAVRALSLLGLAVAAAGALVLLIWPRAPRSLFPGLGGAILVGAAVMLAATLLHLVIVDRDYTGLGLFDLLFRTRVGGFWLVRLGAALLAGTAVAFVADSPRRASAGVVGALVLYSLAYSSTSHAAAGVGSNWATVIDLLHGTAAILWIGAVIGVALAARLAGRGARYRDLLPRFSLLASVLVFILLTSGALSGFIEVDTPGRLADTRYGVTLLVKLGLMVPLLAVAGYNARWGRRRLMADAPGEPRRFIATATAEGLLGIAVFALAAILTQTTVSKSIVDVPSPKPFEQVAPVDDLSVALRIDPNRTGLNTYRVTLTDPAKTPVAADRVRLTFRYQDDQTIGASNLVLAPATGATGQYVGQGPFLTLEGQWRVEVTVRRPNADDATAFFDVRPAGAAVTRGRTGGPWDNPAPGLSWNEFGGLIALVVGLGVALWRRPLAALARWAAAAATILTIAGFGFGVLLLFGVHTHATGEPFLANPIIPDQDSIAKGRALFQQNCVGCHGATGVPPKGLDLDPYPLDLTAHVPQHPDGQLFRFISQGLPGSAMRAWGEGDGRLSNDQVWHLVNYLRTLRVVDQ